MKNILKWITAHIPSDLAEFKRWLKNHRDTNLYDQEIICWFLDAKNLCRLHAACV